MKKITLFFCLVFFASNVFSQSFGIKVGLNLTTISSSSIDNYNEFKEPFQLSPLVGLVSLINITDKIYLASEISYSRKGVSFKFPETSLDNQLEVVPAVKNTVLMDYIDISPSLVYLFNDNYSFLTGFYAGFMFSLLESWENNRWIYTEDSSGYKNVDNRWDFGIQFGPSASIVDNFSIDVLCKLGLTNIGDSSSITDDLKHRSLNLGFRYMF